MSADRNGMGVEGVGFYATRQASPEECDLDDEWQDESAEDREVAEAPRPKPVGGAPGRKWTAHEQDRLRMTFGIHPIAQMARDFGRTPKALVIRARALGLIDGCVQGFEYESRAAERAGFHLATFRRVLRAGGVGVRPAPSIAKGRRRIVEPHDVDRAVAEWCDRETVKAASRRVGWYGPALKRALLHAIADGLIPESLPVPLKHWHVSRKSVDLVVGRETQKQAAERVGVSGATLRRWLREAGVVRPRPGSSHWFVAPDTVDRIVAEKKAAGSWAFRRQTMTKEENAS